MAFTTISSGQHPTGTVVNTGDYVTVVSGASVTSASVDGGFLVVGSGGSATSTTVLSGFEQLPGGVESGGFVSSGYLQVGAGGTAEDVTVANGGSLLISSGGSGTGITLLSGVDALVYSGGTFTTADLSAGTFVDFGGIAYAPGATATVDPTTDILSIVEGGVTTDIQLEGDYSQDRFSPSSDLALLTFGQGPPGTQIAVQSVACYAASTSILTDRGERPAGDLAANDVVVTASAARRPIRWVGRRSYAGRFLAANPNVRPVRFRAGSLGGGLPRRDLLVSPEHAMFLDGVLVPAKLLVNGSTIARDTDLARIDYVHIELDTHDVVLAEGAPSETFIDCDSRGLFHNAHTFNSPAPDGSFCAPRVEDGPVLARIRERLGADGRKSLAQRR